MFVCYVWCVLSGRSLCDGLFTCQEESYRLWRVVVCDHETSWNEEAIARAGLQSQREEVERMWRCAVFGALHNCIKFNTPETGNENNISSKRVFRKEVVLVDTASHQLCSCMNITISRRKEQITEQEL
jgi:hypothetical protein